MLISKQLAEKIVQRSMSIIHHNVNVIDHNGIIIASGEKKRVGELHRIACNAIRTRKRIVVDSIYKNEPYENVQPGINHPIIIDDQVVLVIGVSGNPAAIERYVELAILTAELLLQQSNEIRQINWNYRIRDLLFKQFLDSTKPEECDKALKQLINYNIDFNSQLKIVLINVRIDGFQQEKAIDHIINTLSIFIRSQRVILLSNDEILLLLNSADEKNIVQQIDSFLITQLSHYVIGIGIWSNNTTAFKQSFFLVKNMVDSCLQLHLSSRLFHVEDYALDGLLNNAKDSPYLLFFNEKIQQIVSSVSGEILINTLIVFIQENAQIVPAITRLNIHRNTLTYRFKQIKKITNLDPLKFVDLTKLMVALHYYDSNHILLDIEQSTLD